MSRRQTPERERERDWKLQAMNSLVASPSSFHYRLKKIHRKPQNGSARHIRCCLQHDEPNDQIGRREIILRTSEIATIGAVFNLSGTKPSYLGVQKNPPSLALCPATKNCISTSENSSDRTHYAPPWNYNPEGGRGSKNPVSRQEAMEELLQVIESTKPDNFMPRIMEKKDDYVCVEYEFPILGLVDDVEFWFRPGERSIVEYRSASRVGNFDFDANRKRIKALRQELEKKGWASESGF